MDKASNQDLGDPHRAVPAEVMAAIDRMHVPIVIGHVRPDADALGSMLALARAWSDGAQAPKLSLPAESLSQRLSFMWEMTSAAIATIDDFAVADGFVVVDTAKKTRCGIEKRVRQTDWAAGRVVVNIDHHATNTMFGDVNWVIADAGSTCELVYLLLRAADWPIDPVTASLLYAGIHSDTAGFSLPTTTASAMHAAADLVQRGADVARIGERLCRSQSPSEFALLRTIYANTRVVADGRIAYSTASRDEIAAAGCTAADIDDQVAVPRSLSGVVLSMLLTEGVAGRTRINFRGVGTVTVAELAAEYGGGGHNQSAGAILDCGLEEAVQRVVLRATVYLNEHL